MHALSALALVALAFAQEPSLLVPGLDAALSLVPADAVAAFVIPNLKRASDDLSSCLERTDRAEALLVGRPMDLLKARLGVSVGVRDDGAIVGFLRWPEAATEPIATLLIPANDAKSFLEANFKRAEANPEQVQSASGLTFFTKTLDVPQHGAWVGLSTVPAGLEGLQFAPNQIAPQFARLGRSRLGIALTTDFVAWIDGAALRRGMARAIADSSQIMARAPGIDVAGQIARLGAISTCVKNVALSCDIDPLGLLVRSVAIVDPSTEIGALFGSPLEFPFPQRLVRVPDQPFYAALGVDLAGLGGAAPLLVLAPELKPFAWLVEGVDELSLAIYPSKLGVAMGGVLNDAALLLRTRDVAGLRSAFEGELRSAAGESPGEKRVAKWESDKPVKDSGNADAFELTITSAPLAPGAEPDPNSMIRTLVRGVLFGSRGFHGFVRPLEQALLLTFSQRPDVLRRGTEAAGSEKGLGANAMIIAMREFLIRNADVEVFIDLSRLGKLVTQLAGTFGLDGAALPQLDFGLEPFAAALEVDRHEIECAAIVPSGVLGAMIDMAEVSQTAP